MKNGSLQFVSCEDSSLDLLQFSAREVLSLSYFEDHQDT